MVVTITMSQLWWNKEIMDIFFRPQAQRTLFEVMDKVTDTEKALEIIEDYFDDLDVCEETFYNDSTKDIIKMLELPIIEES